MPSDAADNAEPRTGGELLLDTLLAEGADLAFCVPGESYLAVLDALYDRQDRFRMIVCRHEGGAANMAEACGKLTGRPGIVLVNNGSYGSIRMHQEREYPGRPVATDLENPDFVALARSYGAYGEQVERTEDFPAAYQRAASCGGPALLELKIGIEDMLAANPRA